MAKAKQFIISRGIQFFKSVYEDVYKLTCVNEDGYDPKAPCLFVGYYYDEDFRRLRMHEGPSIFVWAGTDAYSPASIEKTRVIPNLKNIAISDWISGRFDRMGIEYERVNLVTTKIDYWQPSKLGSKIYAYAPSFLYNIDMVRQLEDTLPYEMIISESSNHFTKQELKDIYKECFIGLRLTSWDGNSATVQELGLSGRRCIWNGGTPSAVPWETIDDIEEIVDIEAKKIGTSQNFVRTQVLKSLELGTDWLEV